MANSKIRQSAKGEECQVKFANVCNFNNDTTVFAHIGGGGMGRKQSDLFGTYCCSDCHDLADGRTHNTDYIKAVIDCYFYEGIFRTQQILLDKGLIKI